MGLDIMTYRLLKEPENPENYFIVDKKFPQWTRKFTKKKTVEEYDWEEYEKIEGLDIDKCQFYWSDGQTLVIGDENKKELRIDLKKVPKKTVEYNVIYYHEVGYQRKGLNKKFYEDYDSGKIGYFVWSKKELETYIDKYCENEEIKKHFKEHIVDTFIEGEIVSVFDW